MQKHHLTTSFLACATLALALTIPAQAQNNRSFVSTLGSDANGCTSSAHCRTFTRALAVTNPNGEIVVVDSGGYGPATIAQPVTISAVGIVASIAQPTGSQNALTINTSGNVTLIGLSLHGLGTGHDGILVQQVGFLRLYNVTTEHFAHHGVEFNSAGNLAIYDSRFNDSVNAGLAVTNSSASAYVHNSGFDHNQQGVFLNAGTVAVADSYAHYNSVGFEADGGTLVLTRDQALFNQTGVLATFATTLVQFSYCTITQNTVNSVAVFSSAAVRGSNPGTSVVTGTMAGSLSAAAVLQ